MSKYFFEQEYMEGVQTLCHPTTMVNWSRFKELLPTIWSSPEKDEHWFKKGRVVISVLFCLKFITNERFLYSP